MNIKYHLIIGIGGAIVLQEPFFLIGNIIPDTSLIYNEYKIRKDKIIFNPEKVDNISLLFYRLTHSIWFILLGCGISKYLGIGILIHLIMDSFTHTGTFSLMPFFPISYKIKYGKEILK